MKIATSTWKYFLRGHDRENDDSIFKATIIFSYEMHGDSDKYTTTTFSDKESETRTKD